MRLAYPVELADDDGGWTVSFPDVPEAITWGADRAAALETIRRSLEDYRTRYGDPDERFDQLREMLKK